MAELRGRGASGFYAGHVRFVVASAALVAAVLGVVYLLRERPSLMPSIGAGLMALGTPLVPLVSLASGARSRLRSVGASPEAMSPPTRLRAESR
jgi:hypothetical protein